VTFFWAYSNSITLLW